MISSGPEKSLVAASAPGRAGIIGNPSDMFGGAVISCTVGMRAKTVLTTAPCLILETAGFEESIDGPSSLVLKGDRFDIARAVLNYTGLPRPACRIYYETAIPMQSGMAGSTALIVTLLQALLAWKGEYPDLYQLAEKARYIEKSILKVICGFQDAYMCVFGGLNYMEFNGKIFNDGSESGTYASIEPLSSLELPFLLASTGVKHSSGEVHRPASERWLAGEAEAAEGYKRIAETAREGRNALIKKDWALLGNLMNENHVLQRSLGGSGEANERLIEAALDAGAAGAKLAGAGKGGTIIALWPHQETAPLEKVLIGAGATAVFRLQDTKGAVIEKDE